MPHIFQGYEGATLGAELATSDAGSRNDGQLNQVVAKNSPASIRAVADPIVDGGQALLVEFAANTAAYVRYGIFPASATTRCSWTVPFRSGTPLATAVEVLAFRSSSGNVAKISTGPTGLFSVQAVNTTIAQGPAVQPGGVYWLCLAVTPGTTTSNGRIEWEIYERYGTTPIWSGDTGATVNVGTLAVSLLQVGSSGSPTFACSQGFDAWTATTELATGFPPRVEYTRPLAENYAGVTDVPLHYMAAGGLSGSSMSMVNGALRLTTTPTSDSVSQWIRAYHTRAPAVADSAGVLALINTPTMVGGEMHVRLSDRGANSTPDNGFSLRLTLNALGETASADIIRYVDGTATVVSSMNVSGMMLGGSQWVRLERVGQVVRFKLWSSLVGEPTAWTRSADTAAELGGAQTKRVRLSFLRRVTSVSGGGSMDVSRVTTYDPSAVPNPASLSGEGTLTVGGAPGASTPAALSGDGALSASVTPRAQAAAALAGGGVLAVVAQPTATSGHALSGAGSISASGAPALGVPSALSGDGQLTVAPKSGAGALAASGGTGTLAAGGRAQTPAAVMLSGDGTIQASVASAILAQVALGGNGELTVSAQGGNLERAALTGGGALIANTRPAVTGVIALSGTGELMVLPALMVPAQAMLTGSGSLVVVPQVGQRANVGLSGSGELSALSRAASSLDAFLAGTGQLGAGDRAAFIVVAALMGSGELIAVGVPGGPSRPLRDIDVAVTAWQRRVIAEARQSSVRVDASQRALQVEVSI